MSFKFPLLVPLSLSPLPNPIAPISLLSPPLLRTLQNSPDPSPIPLSHSLSSVRRRWSPIAMSSSDVRSSSTYEITELHAEADFEKLLSPDGRISICGFGSLLSGTYSWFIVVFVDSLFGFSLSKLRWWTREKCEEFVSGAHGLQSCEVERFSAHLRSCRSDFLWARNCEAGDEGVLAFLLFEFAICKYFWPKLKDEARVIILNLLIEFFVAKLAI